MRAVAARRVVLTALLLTACGDGPEIVEAPPSDEPLAEQVRAAAEQARADGKRLVVYVGASWCEPCLRFHQAVEAGDLDDRLPGVRFLELDMDRDGARLAEAGYVDRYVPLFVIPGPDGRATDRRLAGAVKGDEAVDFIAPRLEALLEQP